jgi:hypothetical protein
MQAHPFIPGSSEKPSRFLEIIAMDRIVIATAQTDRPAEIAF